MRLFRSSMFHTVIQILKLPNQKLKALTTRSGSSEILNQSKLKWQTYTQEPKYYCLYQIPG